MRVSEALVRGLLEPLGYEIAVTSFSRYVGVSLRATLRLSALLTHLYVLLPVLEDEKHYGVDETEVEKLRRRGDGWLDAHPERELIPRRYLKHERRLYGEFMSEREETRWPERSLVPVPAAREYYAPVRPLRPAVADDAWTSSWTPRGGSR